MSAGSPDLVAATDLAVRNLACWSAQLAFITLALAGLGRAMPVEKPAARLALGQGLLVLALALPVLQPWRTLAPGIDWSFGLASAPAAGSAARHAWAQMRATAPSWSVVVAVGLVVGLAAQLARLALGLVRLRMLERGARPLDVPRWLTDLGGDVAPRARFVVTDRACAPATFGLRRPTIVLPPAFLGMDRGHQHAVALHELLHARRGDWLALLVEELLKALLFFHPAVHWLVGRVRMAREQCVDAAVVRRLGSRDTYLDSLVEVARIAVRARAVPAAPFLRQSHLRERVELLLKETPMSSRRTLVHVGLTAGAVMLAGAWAVSAFPLTARGELPNERRETPASVQPRLVHKVDPVYPPEARPDNAGGLFVIDAVVDRQGFVKDAKLLISTPRAERLGELMPKRGTPAALEGDKRLAKAAIEAITQWRYEPVVGANGEPTEARVTVTVRFKPETSRH